MPRWTPESRARQAELARQNKPWKNATGPKSETGKKTSSANAYKHGDRCALELELRGLLALQHRLLLAINEPAK